MMDLVLNCVRFSPWQSDFNYLSVIKVEAFAVSAPVASRWRDISCFLLFNVPRCKTRKRLLEHSANFHPRIDETRHWNTRPEELWTSRLFLSSCNTSGEVQQSSFSEEGSALRKMFLAGGIGKNLERDKNVEEGSLPVPAGGRLRARTSRRTSGRERRKEAAGDTEKHFHEDKSLERENFSASGTKYLSRYQAALNA